MPVQWAEVELWASELGLSPLHQVECRQAGGAGSGASVWEVGLGTVTACAAWGDRRTRSLLSGCSHPCLPPHTDARVCTHAVCVAAVQGQAQSSREAVLCRSPAFYSYRLKTHCCPRPAGASWRKNTAGLTTAQLGLRRAAPSRGLGMGMGAGGPGRMLLPQLSACGRPPGASWREWVVAGLWDRLGVGTPGLPGTCLVRCQGSLPTQGQKQAALRPPQSWGALGPPPPLGRSSLASVPWQGHILMRQQPPAQGSEDPGGAALPA